MSYQQRQHGPLQPECLPLASDCHRVELCGALLTNVEPDLRPHSGWPREFSLAVACCRQLFAEDADAALRELARQVDGERFVALTRRHRIQGLAAQALRGQGDMLPVGVAAILVADARAIAAEGLRTAAQCRLLLEHFQAAGVDLLFLKGGVVGQLAYGNPLAKMSWDIDLLVAEEAIPAAGQVLARLGYTAPPVRDLQKWHRTFKESTWVPAGGAPVELHSRLADNRGLIRNIGLQSARQWVELLPGLALPTLADDELAIYLAVHGASSAWFRLKWIADFAGVLRARTREELAALWHKAAEQGAGRAFGQALLLSNVLFGSPRVPARRVDQATKWLVSVALQQLINEREPTERRLGTASIHLSQLLLRRGPAFALGEAVRQGRELLSRFTEQRRGAVVDEHPPQAGRPPSAPGTSRTRR